jgi:predicted nucleic-acid-binding protein
LIGLDTNILLRAVLDDDPVQSPSARSLLQSFGEGRRGFVNTPVLMEFFWVLRTRYKLPRSLLARAMRGLLEVEYLEFEALETISRALAIFESGMADFPDAVIAMRNRELGADMTFTFDQDAANSLPSMELLS